MRLLIILILLIKLSDANCQYDLVTSSTNTPSTPTLEAYDLSGKRIPMGANAEADGSKMLNDQFVKGIVKFKNGQQYKDVQLNLSLTNNELYFKKESITLTFLYPVDEFSLSLKSRSSGSFVYFKSGFPAIAGNTDRSFYQVLSHGSKACFLKYIYKTAEEHYQYGGPVQKEWVLNERYYVYDIIHDRMSEINLNGNSIKKSLADYANYIVQYESSNKINFKKEENVKSLIDFINEQPQE